MSMPTYRVTIARSDGRYAAAEVSHEQLNDQIFMADAVDKMRASLARAPRRTNGGSLGVEDEIALQEPRHDRRARFCRERPHGAEWTTGIRCPTCDKSV